MPLRKMSPVFSGTSNIFVDRLIGLGVSVHDYWPWGRGHFQNFKCGLGLEWDLFNQVRTIGYLLDWEVVDDLIKKVYINRFDGA